MIQFPDFDPVAFSVGPLAVRWYALAYIAGLLFAIWYAKRLVANKSLWEDRQPTLTSKQVDDLFIWIALGVILGGRLGYVLFYNPLHYLGSPLDIAKMWLGGMSFHGGFLGVVIALLIYGRRHRATLDRLLDLGAAATPLGLGLGRLANFINGELYGRAGNVPWAIIFPNDPQQIPRHPSQLYEAILEGFALFLVVRLATHCFKALAHPGRASGLFALFYGLSRIVVEFFREPDTQLGYFLGFITMGMILSFPLVAVGIWLLARSRHT
jgi:phosphatidylglycerol:prolipoprotein diacylglycerol transferase